MRPGSPEKTAKKARNYKLKWDTEHFCSKQLGRNVEKKEKRRKKREKSLRGKQLSRHLLFNAPALGPYGKGRGKNNMGERWIKK